MTFEAVILWADEEMNSRQIMDQLVPTRTVSDVWSAGDE